MYSNTDNAWKTIGKTDPYFGVLTQPRYHQDSLDEENLHTFFQSGDRHVGETLATARERIDAPERFRSVLDFGCGVGRLTIPFAQRADEVTGVDISPGMLQEAEANTQRMGEGRVRYLHSDKVLGGAERYELVHTYIVLQHISTSRGFDILRGLIELIEAGGYGILHLTYAKTSSFGRWNNRLRKWVPLLNPAINLLRGRSLSTPMMQMNDYDLNKVFRLIQSQGVEGLHTVFSDHGGNLGVSLYFKKPKRSVRSRSAA